MDEARAALEGFVASFRLCEHPFEYCPGSLWFVVQPVELVEPVRLGEFSGNTTVTVRMVALLRDCFYFDSVVVAGHAANADVDAGCSFWVAAVEREAYYSLEQLLEPAASTETSRGADLSSCLESLLDQAVVVPVRQSPAGEPCFADALFELEHREATRLAACEAEPQLTVVTDEGETFVCSLQVPADNPFMNSILFQTIRLKAQLPVPCEVYDRPHDKTQLVEKLYIIVSRMWLKDRSRWSPWSLDLSVRVQNEKYDLPCCRQIRLAAYITDGAENLPGLYAEMKPVPYWLIREFFDSYPNGWEWVKELQLWMNPDRDEYKARWDYWERHNPQTDEPYATAEDGFWGRVEPSRR